MKGIKINETPIIPMNQINNFIRPHHALGGSTPAKAAGIEICGGREGVIKKSRGNQF